MTYFLIILGLLPGFVWLFFYLQEDTHAEPKKLVALVFLAGAFSAFAAFLLEKFFDSIAFPLGIGEYSVLSLLIFAFIEESVKFGAAYLTTRKNASFIEPVDAMIYTVVAALGFATLENVAALFHGASASPFLTLGDVFTTAAFRFSGTTLLHSLASAIVGYYWAWSIREFNLKKLILKGLIIASLLHMFFNFLILYYRNLLYPIAFVAILGFFVLNDFEKLKRKKI